MILFVTCLTLSLVAGPLFPASAASSIPKSAYISGVTGHAQAYTLSCEARSAADWAAFWGVDIGETDFLQGLPGSDNPDRGFVGDPDGVWGSIPPRSYGVYAKPVAARLKEYGLNATARRGLNWDDLRLEIAAGRPVIVWIIGQMWSGTPITYTAKDGKKVTVARFEHTMILVGYDASQVHVVDAYSGLTQTYPLNTFLASWGVLGNMAVVGEGRPAPAQKQASGKDSYTVQSGDYLTGLAERFGTTWQELAKLNDISYPYTIYAGQVLKLPGGAPPQKPKATSAPPKPTKTPRPTPTATAPLTPTLAVNRADLTFKNVFPIILSSGGLAKPAVTAAPTSVAAVTGAPKKKKPATYTVQRGDYLIDLADTLGVDWRELADLNQIYYPWVIYPGQVLKLPGR